MSFTRVPGAGSTGLPQIPPPGGGSVIPGGGAKTQPGRPDDLSTRPMPATTQSTMAPRTKLPGGPAARASFKSAGPAPASPDHVAQEPTPVPAGAGTYEFYMNQLSGLRVDPPPAKGPADGAAQPEKPAAQSPLPASTGGGAKSDDPFNWSSKLFPAGGDTLPPAASGTGAKPEGRPYELPPNPFDTAGTPRPSSPAFGGGTKPPVKPAAESPLNTFFTIDPPPSKPAASSSSKPEKPAAESAPSSAAAGGSAKPEGPFDWLGGSLQPSTPPSGGTKPGTPTTELPLNTFFTVDPPPPPTPPAAPGGGGPDQPEKPQVQASVTIEPGGNQPHGEPMSDADKMKKSQEDYMANMWQTQATANANTLLTAQLKNESDMNSAMANIVKQNGRGMKDMAAG